MRRVSPEAAAGPAARIPAAAAAIGAAAVPAAAATPAAAVAASAAVARREAGRIRSWGYHGHQAHRQTHPGASLAGQARLPAERARRDRAGDKARRADS